MSRQSARLSIPVVAAVVSMLMVLGAGAAGEAQEVKLQTSMENPQLPAFDPFLLELQERTFRFFWDTANPQNGLIPDRYPTPSYSSIAAVGFGLTTYPIGVERGYITRDQARQRVLATLRFFSKAPQSADPRGAAGHRGFFYHFLDMKTGERFGDSELSTVDTAILLAGACSVSPTSTELTRKKSRFAPSWMTSIGASTGGGRSRRPPPSASAGRPKRAS
jgi:hypothetical protein